MTDSTKSDSERTCRMPGCDNPAEGGHAVCSDPDCFGFRLPFLDGFISAKEMYRDLGLQPTADIVCNKDYGFFLEYADSPNSIEEVLDWAPDHIHQPEQNDRSENEQ